MKINTVKCPICHSSKNVTLLGIDENQKKRIYQCTCKEDDKTRKSARFDEEGVSILRFKAIKCPQCSKSEFIKFNGNQDRGFVCRNRVAHKDNQKVSFRIKRKTEKMTLKKYLNYMNPELYNYLHKLYKNAKRVKDPFLNRDDVVLCVELGLNQKIIGKIFQVNQSTVSRFIKNRKIISSRDYKYRVKQVGKIPDKVFYTSMRVAYEGLERFEIEEDA